MSISIKVIGAYVTHVIILYSEIYEEERILKCLSELYKTDDFYIPPRTAGQKLPTPILEFYEIVKEQIRKILQEEEELKSDGLQSVSDAMKQDSSIIS